MCVLESYSASNIALVFPPEFREFQIFLSFGNCCGIGMGTGVQYNLPELSTSF